MLQHSCLASLSCFIFASSFIFMSHESPQQSCLPSEFASPSFFISHESPVQHDSFAQQVSGFFFWSPGAGVCCADTAENIASSKPRTRIVIRFLRGFIVVLLYPEVERLHAGHNGLTRASELSSRQISRSERHNNEDGLDYDWAGTEERP